MKMKIFKWEKNLKNLKNLRKQMMKIHSWAMTNKLKTIKLTKFKAKPQLQLRRKPEVDLNLIKQTKTKTEMKL